MQLANQPIFEQKNLQGIDDVQLALERLGHDLPRAGLQHLDNFNRTYLIITRDVRQQLKKGSFEHPDFLNRFDRRFAYYYLHALQNYLTGNTQAVPRAWRRAFRYASRPHASPFICMALGVNAHVNNDIPQVLRDCGASKVHLRDYRLVNRIIGGSLDEVISLFRHSGSILNPNRRLLNLPYKLGMRLLIRVWRWSAWRKYQKLRRQQTDIPAIEQTADRLAGGINKLPL
ncbi:MAG TPA: DUF5995 family protein [Candidatus Saccharimonadales bacterium]|nr:DUF5995 family protein [Candidatus Saccharimonadales bacterium]